MDELRYDGLYGYLIYRVLYKVHNETRFWVHAEDDNELFLEEDGEVVKGGGCAFSAVTRYTTKTTSTPTSSLFVSKQQHKYK